MRHHIGRLICLIRPHTWQICDCAFTGKRRTPIFICTRCHTQDNTETRP